MPNDTIQFNDIAKTLRDELSLINDDDPRIKELEIAKALNKRLDEIELNEQDFIIMDELCILRYLPDALVHQEFGTDSLNAQFYSLFEENPKRAISILNKLLKSEPEFVEKNYIERTTTISFGRIIPVKQDEKTIIVTPEEEQYPIKQLMDKLQSSNNQERSDASAFLEMRFWGQSLPCQIQIIKAVLSAKSLHRMDWLDILLNNWWDDAIMPDVEKAWLSYGEPECARVIMHRFPLDYVLMHQEELGKADYQFLCMRLAKEEGFNIDKSRLSQIQYYQVLANTHMRLNDDEAESLLFGRVKRLLNRNYKPWIYAVDNYYRYSRTAFDCADFYNNPDKYLKLLLNYKPTLYFLSDLKGRIQLLIQTGNTNTVVKFIAWNKYLQQNIPSFLSEESDQKIALQQLGDRFREYRSRSWERLIDLARETFPVEIKVEAKGFLDDDEDNEWDYFEPY